MKKQDWWQKTFGVEYGEAFEHFYDQKKTDDEVGFLRRFAGVKSGSRVLDLPCGQGRHTAALASMGCDVTGVDYSADLLKFARARLKEKGLKAEVRRGDMRRINLGGKFDVVATLGNSFGYFSDADNEKFIACVASHLKRGGRFVLDLSNVPGLLRNPLGASRLEFPGGHISTESYSFDPLAMRLKIKWEIEAGGKVKRTNGALRLYTPPEAIGLFEKHGFRVKKAYGNFSGDAFGIDTPRCILVAERK